MLVLGAGAIGGYFGGRLLELGQDVTFLVRPHRAATLSEHGLIIRSGQGDATISKPPLVLADRLDAPFDVVLLSCKAYDLEDAMHSVAPAVGPATAILPLLNGMRHLDALSARFGARHVLGGQCVISATVDAQGAVKHLGDTHLLTFGEMTGERSQRVEAIAAAMQGARFDSRASETILLDMWEKWIFIATMAGITCLVQGSVGDIVGSGGSGLIEQLLDECRSIATREGFALRPEALARARTILTQAGSPLAASMLRDMQSGAATEADHVIGDLLRRAPSQDTAPLLHTALVRLKVYEAQRQRKA